jgi:hypothetical protein
MVSLAVKHSRALRMRDQSTIRCRKTELIDDRSPAMWGASRRGQNGVESAGGVYAVSGRVEEMKPSTFIPSVDQLGAHVAGSWARNRRAKPDRDANMAAAQAGRDAMIERHYADPDGVPFGGPRKAPERGASGIARMRADLRDGRLTLQALRGASIGELARHYRMSPPSASRAKARLLAGDPPGWHARVRASIG